MRDLHIIHFLLFSSSPWSPLGVFFFFSWVFLWLIFGETYFVVYQGLLVKGFSINANKFSAGFSQLQDCSLLLCMKHTTEQKEDRSFELLQCLLKLDISTAVTLQQSIITRWICGNTTLSFEGAPKRLIITSHASDCILISN